MGAVNTHRIEVRETRTTFTEKRLSGVLDQIDARLNCANVWETITRTGGLISKIEVFSNAAKTIKVMERDITRTTGSDGVDYITGMVTKFFNSDTTEDSRVTTTITRDADDNITECANVFTTTELQDC